MIFVRLCLIFLCLASNLQSACQKEREKSPFADFGKKIFPAGVPVVALLKGDIPGVVISATVIQVLYASNRYLKPWFDIKRPCGCVGGFPSGHAIMMGSGASFLAFRYGWRFGIPAMILTLLLHVDRVETQGHTWADVIETLVIYHLVTGLIVTRRGRRWRDKWLFLLKFKSTK